MKEASDGSCSSAYDRDSASETTVQMKCLKIDNQPIMRRHSKRKKYLMTWEDTKILTCQVKTVGRQQGHYTIDPKMMLYLLTILHVNSQLVNAESKSLFWEEGWRHTCNRKEIEWFCFAMLRISFFNYQFQELLLGNKERSQKWPVLLVKLLILQWK